jgi:hypothetical protein
MVFEVVACIHVVVVAVVAVVAVIAESGIQGVKICNVSTTRQRSGRNVEGNCVRRQLIVE